MLLPSVPLEERAIGLVSSHFPSGGLAVVGGFYLIVGLINRKPVVSAIHDIGSATAGADNLVAEAIVDSRETSASTGHQRDLVGASR